VVSLPMNPLAQIMHVKTRLSAAGEYVQTSREFERTLRDVGYSRTVARKIVAVLRPDSGGMPEPEDVDVASAVRAIEERIIADRIKTLFGIN